MAQQQERYTVTALSPQVRDSDRVNVYIDGKYDFSLDISQVVDLGIKAGQVLSKEELASLKQESEFGKLYARTLEYVLMRRVVAVKCVIIFTVKHWLVNIKIEKLVS